MIFIQNKYTKWYFNIINAAQNRTIIGYTETHHIIPKSLGGDNSVSNLVVLSAKEHFICHLLLAKMTKGIDQTKMLMAINMMSVSSSNQSRYKINSSMFDSIKQKLSESRKGIPARNKGHRLSEDQKQKLRGKVFSQSHRENISKSKKGWKPSDEFKQHLSTTNSGSGNPMFGKSLSAEAREKISKTHKGNPKPERSPETLLKLRVANQMNVSEFIHRANIVHNNFYDYSCVEYVNNRTNIIICCPLHGAFFQTPGGHLNGQGCKNCGIIKRSNSKIKKSYDKFIHIVSAKFNNKFQYIEDSFTGMKGHITFICPTHGTVNQSVSGHLHSMYGCIECKNVIKN